jgi:adenylate cyclase
VDEEGTLSDLKRLRAMVVDPLISEHRGRVVKTTGDGTLVGFASAVKAADCAVKVQRRYRRPSRLLRPGRPRFGVI